jgi:hypothetical protein
LCKAGVPCRATIKTLGILGIAILVITDIFLLIHAVCASKMTAVGVAALAKVAFEGALMTEICHS